MRSWLQAGPSYWCSYFILGPRRGGATFPRAAVVGKHRNTCARILFLLFESKFMATTKINSLITSARRDIARELMDQARVVLVYLGIVATFTAATLIGCVIWLLIW